MPLNFPYAGTRCGHFSETMFQNELMTGFVNAVSLTLSRFLFFFVGGQNRGTPRGALFPRVNDESHV